MLLLPQKHVLNLPVGGSLDCGSHSPAFGQIQPRLPYPIIALAWICSLLTAANANQSKLSSWSYTLLCIVYQATVLVIESNVSSRDVAWEFMP